MAKIRYPNHSVPFNSGFRITQFFGSNASYYKKFGLDGHEGLDLVPLSGDWNIKCIEHGVVIRDIDDPIQGKAYGNYVLVWNEKNKRGWWYCHMVKNMVEHGQFVKRGQILGRMGDTGNTSGAHLHLGLRYGTKMKRPINMDNGYMGFVDPLPVVLKIAGGGDLNKMEIEKDTFEQLVTKATELDELKGGKTVNGKKLVDETWIEERKQEIQGLNKQNQSLKDQTAEIYKALDVTQFSEAVGEIEKLIGFEDILRRKNKELEDANKKVDRLEVQNGGQKSTILELSEKVLKLEQEIRQLRTQPTTTPPKPPEKPPKETRGLFDAIVSLIKRLLTRGGE